MSIDDLAELNPDALLADGLVERDGMTHEEADEYLSVNTLGAYVGENGPIYVRTVT